MKSVLKKKQPCRTHVSISENCLESTDINAKQKAPAKTSNKGWGLSTAIDVVFPFGEGDNNGNKT